MKKILFIIVGAILGTTLVASAASVFATFQGGTGTSTPSGILYGDNGVTTALKTVTVGSGLTFAGGTLTATGNGTVTNIATTFPIQGGPITTTGTLTFGGLSTTSPFTIGGLAAVGPNQNKLYSISTSTLSGSGVITVTAGAFILGSNPITIACATCSTTSGTVTSVAAGTGINGGTITSSGTLSLKSYLATSTADTANQISVFTSTNATPATFGGFANFTYNSTTQNFVVINASTTNVTVSQSLYATDASSTVRRVTGQRALSFTLASTTNWTGTSSASTMYGDGGTVYAPFAGTITSMQCVPNVGTLGVLLTSGASTFYMKASTTPNINALSLTIFKGQPFTIVGGTPASSPTTTPCTLVAQEN